jgi:ABC-type spermidine/putrescine transport system permease subunit II
MNIVAAARRRILQAGVLVVLMILLIPISMIILSSLTSQSFPTLPSTIDFRWYGDLLTNRLIHESLIASFIVATFSSILATIIGTVTAYGFVRHEFPFKELFSTLMLFPLMISPIITGVAIIQYVSHFGVSGGYLTLIMGHTVLVFPFVFLIIRSALSTFDRDLEKSSIVLGATPTASFINITIPIITPALTSAVLVAFLVSFGEFTATQFLVSADTTTVPVVIYTMMRTGVTPVITALGTVLIVIMIIFGIMSEVLG